MYTIWRTPHEINQRVVDSFRKGTLVLSDIGEPHQLLDVSLYNPHKPLKPSISYGFRRGTDYIFQRCMAEGIEWWEIDRGYFRANHYDGYYRISLNDIRAKFNAELELPDDRWKALGIQLKDWKRKQDGYVLVCPPTYNVGRLFGINPTVWEVETRARLGELIDLPLITRDKHEDANIPLEHALEGAYAVVAYNSNVAIQALVQGTPAFLLDDSFQTPLLDTICTEDRFFDRERLFRYLSYCQFTLQEFENGTAWETAYKIQKFGVFDA